VLTDDVARYRKGLDLYHVTVGDYLRWGRGNFRSNRIVGEVGVVVKNCPNAVWLGSYLVVSTAVADVLVIDCNSSIFGGQGAPGRRPWC
jgi:hypothetical protein